jgi:hypothetical protein
MGWWVRPGMRARDCSRATPVEASTAMPAMEESEPSTRTRTVAERPSWRLRA